MKTINQQILDREIILSECDGWKVKGIFERELFEGIIAVEAYQCFILSNNNSISGLAPKDKRGYKRAQFLCGKDNFCIEDALRNMTIYSFEQPKEDVDIQIQKLKEVINPDPYKIYEGRISDDEADAKEYERVKWEVRRYELAKAAMQGILANPNTAHQIRTQFGDVSAERGYKAVAETSIKITDEMIKQLKNEL